MKRAHIDHDVCHLVQKSRLITATSQPADPLSTLSAMLAANFPAVEHHCFAAGSEVAREKKN